MSQPKYKLWDLVGYEGEVWKVGGFWCKFDYLDISWDYYLLEIDSNGDTNGHYTKTKSPVPEIKLISPDKILKDKIDKNKNETERLNLLSKLVKEKS